MHAPVLASCSEPNFAMKFARALSKQGHTPFRLQWLAPDTLASVQVGAGPHGSEEEAAGGGRQAGQVWPAQRGHAQGLRWQQQSALRAWAKHVSEVVDLLGPPMLRAGVPARPGRGRGS